MQKVNKGCVDTGIPHVIAGIGEMLSTEGDSEGAQRRRDFARHRLMDMAVSAGLQEFWAGTLNVLVERIEDIGPAIIERFRKECPVEEYRQTLAAEQFAYLKELLKEDGEAVRQKARSYIGLACEAALFYPGGKADIAAELPAWRTKFASKAGTFGDGLERLIGKAGGNNVVQLHHQSAA